MPVTTVSRITDGSNIQDIAVSPDGTRVIPAEGAPYEFHELSATTLQNDGIIYPGQAYPSAVTVSPGRGGLVATGLNYGSPQISVFPLGRPQATFTATTSSVTPHGLALTADGSGLFAATVEGPYQKSLTLRSFPLPAG